MDFVGDYLLIDQFDCDHAEGRRLPCDQHRGNCLEQPLVCIDCGEPLPEPDAA